MSKSTMSHEDNDIGIRGNEDDSYGNTESSLGDRTISSDTFGRPSAGTARPAPGADDNAVSGDSMGGDSTPSGGERGRAPGGGLSRTTTFGVSMGADSLADVYKDSWSVEETHDEVSRQDLSSYEDASSSPSGGAFAASPGLGRLDGNDDDNNDDDDDAAAAASSSERQPSAMPASRGGGGDSKLGKLLEKTGETLGSERLVVKGRQKREDARNDDS